MKIKFCRNDVAVLGKSDANEVSIWSFMRNVSAGWVFTSMLVNGKQSKGR